MNPKIEVSLTNMNAAEVVLYAVIDEIHARKYYLTDEDDFALAALLEFAYDLASEIVRVEMWRDEDENE